MVRVKKGVHAAKTRRNVLKMAKGFRGPRKNKEKLAYEQIVHSLQAAFTHRRDKKGDFRRLWNVKINAALRNYGTTYSKFIGLLKKKEIEVDRKMMADLAQNDGDVFKRFVEEVLK